MERLPALLPVKQREEAASILAKKEENLQLLTNILFASLLPQERAPLPIELPFGESTNVLLLRREDQRS